MRELKIWLVIWLEKKKNGEANVPTPRFYFFSAFFFAAFFLATDNASGFYL